MSDNLKKAMNKEDRGWVRRMVFFSHGNRVSNDIHAEFRQYNTIGIVVYYSTMY